MATLTGNSIASTYTQLLKLTSASLGADASAKYIEDGAGTDSALSISTTRVGIGNSAPSYLLHVATASGATDGKGIALTDSAGQLISHLAFQGTTDGSEYGVLNMYNNGTQTVKINSNGDNTYFNGGSVGIGVTDPDRLFHVEESGGDPIALFEDATQNANIVIRATAANKNSILNFGDAASDEIGRIDYDHNDNSLSFVANAAKAMRITSDGTQNQQGNYILEEQGRQNHVANTMSSPYYRFDGVDDKIAITAITGFSDFTVTAYATAVDWDVNSSSSIVGSWSTGSNADWFNIGINSSGQVSFIVDTGDNDGGLIATNYTHSLVDDSWHQLVGVCDRTTNLIYLYLDGVEVATTSFTDNTIINPTNLNIGELGGGYEFWDGQISDVKIFNKALTATEVKELYSGASVPFKYKGANQTELTSGTLGIGKAYRINDWISGDDFTNIGGTNADGNEFVATGTTPTTWSNSSTVVPIGAVAEYDGSGITNDKWYDKSGNELHGTVTGATDENTAGAPVVSENHPAFLVHPASSQLNWAENSSVTVVFGTERFDQGSNFASNTFTAPVTGKYQFDASVYLLGAQTAYDYIELSLKTSNRTYYSIFDSGAWDQDSAYHTINISILADMDETDTVYITMRQHGTAGDASCDIDINSFFSGYLVC